MDFTYFDIALYKCIFSFNINMRPCIMLNVMQLDMSTALWRLRSPRSLSGTSIHPPMVIQRSQSWSGMFDSYPSKFVASSKWRPFWKFWYIKGSFNLTSDMKRSSQIMQKKCIFHDDDITDDVTEWHKSRPPSIFVYKWNNNTFLDN